MAFLPLCSPADFQPSRLYTDYTEARAVLDTFCPDPLILDQTTYVEMTHNVNRRVDDAIKALANRQSTAFVDLLELVTATDREQRAIDPSVAPRMIRLQKAIFHHIGQFVRQPTG